MNVVICGSSAQIERIKRCLRTDVQICGCCDAAKGDIAGADSFPKDVIFIADGEQATILEGKGIPAERTIRYDWFPQTYFDDPISDFSNDYNALILGMSHSQCAISADGLSELSGGEYNYFKESAPSLDLFLHKKFFEKLVNEQAEAVRNLKRVIIEIPYYIFNYDLSLFGDFAFTKLNYFELVGDYHHLPEKVEAKSKIDTFRQYWNVCEKAIYEQPQPRKLPGYLVPLKRIYHIYKAIRNKDKVWDKQYEKTIQENKRLWNELLMLLNQSCPNAEIIVLVMPFNPAFRNSHKVQVAQSKKAFYSCLGDLGKIRLIDEFDYIRKPSLFQDHCHLNEHGGRIYTEHFAEMLSHG